MTEELAAVLQNIVNRLERIEQMVACTRRHLPQFNCSCGRKASATDPMVVWLQPKRDVPDIRGRAEL